MTINSKFKSKPNSYRIYNCRRSFPIALFSWNPNDAQLSHPLFTFVFRFASSFDLLLRWLKSPYSVVCFCGETSLSCSRIWLSLISCIGYKAHCCALLEVWTFSAQLLPDYWISALFMHSIIIRGWHPIISHFYHKKILPGLCWFRWYFMFEHLDNLLHFIFPPAKPCTTLWRREARLIAGNTK